MIDRVTFFGALVLACAAPCIMFDYPNGMMYLTPDMRGHRDMFGRKE